MWDNEDREKLQLMMYVEPKRVEIPTNFVENVCIEALPNVQKVGGYDWKLKKIAFALYSLPSGVRFGV